MHKKLEELKNTRVYVYGFSNYNITVYLSILKYNVCAKTFLGVNNFKKIKLIENKTCVQWSAN